MKFTASEAVRHLWRTGEEVALIDVREEGPYSEAHPFFAVNLPLGEIEMRMLDLVPRLSAPVVVYDDGEGLAELAVKRIEALGYKNVSLLDGGLIAYRLAGEVFRDVNVPSKAFGELVESVRGTPSLSARQVKELIDEEADIVVLDARRFEEYCVMSIPTGVSVPGAELALRVRDLAPNPDTMVIVNCAGRTRSIIGTQSLVNAGIPNKVAALRNGTIGWTLEGYELNTGQTRRHGEVSEKYLAEARAGADRLSLKVGVPVIDKPELDRFIAEQNTRTLYCFDVRSPEEYAAAHPKGFRSAPGGQLVQAIDEWIGVRGARVVLFDDDGVRAQMSASWLKQMGWDVSVMRTGELPCHEYTAPAPKRPPLPSGMKTISVEELRAERAVTVADLAPSNVYGKGHIPGAHFLIASRFREDLEKLPGSGAITLTSPDGELALRSVPFAREWTKRPVRALQGGTAAWTSDGRALEDNKHSWISPQIDRYKRPYEGTDNAREAMQGYIDWEHRLIAQMANDGVSRFHVIR
jgi:rhodanese-related sulfurtransferase